MIKRLLRLVVYIRHRVGFHSACCAIYCPHEQEMKTCSITLRNFKDRSVDG